MKEDSWISNISNKYEKRSNTKIVLDTLEDAILNKNLTPGDAIPSESTLSSSLGVSKSSVREAVKMLEALGVVNVVQGKGTFICKNFNESTSNLLAFQLIVSEKSPKDLIEFRYFFEPMYIEIAASKITSNDIVILKEYIEDFEKKFKTKNLKAEDDIWFHEFLLKKTDNSIITNIGMVLNRIIQKRIKKGVESYPDIVFNDHKVIFEAIVKKDYNLLRKRVIVSIDNWVKVNYGKIE